MKFLIFTLLPILSLKLVANNETTENIELQDNYYAEARDQSSELEDEKLTTLNEIAVTTISKDLLEENFREGSVPSDQDFVGRNPAYDSSIPVLESSAIIPAIPNQKIKTNSINKAPSNDPHYNNEYKRLPSNDEDIEEEFDDEISDMPPSATKNKMERDQDMSGSHAGDAYNHNSPISPNSISKNPKLIPASNSADAQMRSQSLRQTFSAIQKTVCDNFKKSKNYYGMKREKCEN